MANLLPISPLLRDKENHAFQEAIRHGPAVHNLLKGRLQPLLQENLVVKNESEQKPILAKIAILGKSLQGSKQLLLQEGGQQPVAHLIQHNSPDRAKDLLSAKPCQSTLLLHREKLPVEVKREDLEAPEAQPQEIHMGIVACKPPLWQIKGM